LVRTLEHEKPPLVAGRGPNDNAVSDELRSLIDDSVRMTWRLPFPHERDLERRRAML